MEFLEEKKVASFASGLLVTFFCLVCINASFGVIYVLYPEMRISISMCVTVCTIAIFLLSEFIRPKVSSILITNDNYLVHVRKNKIIATVSIEDIKTIYYSLGVKSNEGHYLPIIVVEDYDESNFLIKTKGFDIGDLLSSLENLNDEIDFVETDLTEYL